MDAAREATLTPATGRLDAALLPRDPLPVVAGAEVLLEPHVEDDEEVAASHLLDLQLRLAGPPVAPGDRDDGPAVAAHDRLQGQLDEDVEVRGDERLAAVDRRAPVGLERVRGVVERDAEQQPDEEVGQPVEPVLQPRVVDDAPAGDEAAAEDALPALVELAPVADHVAAVVALVRHHDHDRVAGRAVEPVDDGAPEPVGTGVLRRRELRHPAAQVLQDRPRRVGAPVVDHHDLVRHLVQRRARGGGARPSRRCTPPRPGRG